MRIVNCLGFSTVVSVTTSIASCLGIVAVVLAISVGVAEAQEASSAKKPNIVVIGTGGTIAGAGKVSTDTSTYQTASIAVDAIVAQVPALASVANVTSEQVFQVGSKSMNEELMIKLAKHVSEVLKRGDVDGVVVTHGTDTLEETAYLLNLTVHSDKPIVFAASMRPATAISADGPLNLLDAVIVASSKEAKGKGVLVSLNDEIHTARDVAKTNSFKTDTFKSPYGPLGYVVEGKAIFYRNIIRPSTTTSEFDIEQIDKLPRVDIAYQYTNSDTVAYDALIKAGAKAIVISGTGNGNVSDALLPQLTEIMKKGTVLVRTSRTGSGSLYRGASYSGDTKYGFIAADDQSPVKARLLTALALTKSSDPRMLREVFYRY